MKNQNRGLTDILISIGIVCAAFALAFAAAPFKEIRLSELQPGATVIPDGLSISQNSVSGAENDVTNWVNSKKDDGQKGTNEKNR